MPMSEEQKVALRALVEHYINLSEEHEDDKVLEETTPEQRIVDLHAYLDNMSRDNLRILIPNLLNQVALPIEATVDNRDPRTTWLWVSPHRYVEVDPYDLVDNVIENLPEEERPIYEKAFKEFKDL